MDKKYQDIIKWVESGPNPKSDVLIALKLEEAEKGAPTARGKLQTEDFAKIITRAIKGEPAKVLAAEFKVSEARISEIRREKSIPMAALSSYLEAKAKAQSEVE